MVHCHLLPSYLDACCLLLQNPSAASTPEAQQESLELPSGPCLELQLLYMHLPQQVFQPVPRAPLLDLCCCGLVELCLSMVLMMAWVLAWVPVQFGSAEVVELGAEANPSPSEDHAEEKSTLEQHEACCERDSKKQELVNESDCPGQKTLRCHQNVLNWQPHRCPYLHLTHYPRPSFLSQDLQALPYPCPKLWCSEKQSLPLLMTASPRVSAFLLHFLVRLQVVSLLHLLSFSLKACLQTLILELRWWKRPPARGTRSSLLLPREPFHAFAQAHFLASRAVHAAGLDPLGIFRICTRTWSSLNCPMTLNCPMIQSCPMCLTYPRKHCHSHRNRFSKQTNHESFPRLRPVELRQLHNWHLQLCSLRHRCCCSHCFLGLERCSWHRRSSSAAFADLNLPSFR
mmetsp:Transcript_126858/g.233567  ORF Transcript_126858/g.233567 Transcript_126858/m.233567 type:complete len:400 (-) Transcript_126858:292-1491(-)